MQSPTSRHHLIDNEAEVDIREGMENKKTRTRIEKKMKMESGGKREEGISEKEK